MKVLDKEEFRVKLEEINSLVEKKDYEGAMKVVDSIDWRRVKNVRTLCIVGEIYAANKRYEDSREIFLLAYHRAPIGKNILYRLIEVSLKMGDIEEAQEYYQEFLEVAPDDNTQYILNYKIKTAKGAPLDERIQILEEYKEKEFTEKWSYELAKLYYQSGQKEKCLSVCNEMALWFNDGSYVSKAMELKERMGELTAEEKKKYEPSPVSSVQEHEEEASTESGSSGSVQDDQESVPIESISMKNEKDLASVESIQEKISKGLRDIFGSKKEESQEGKEEQIPEEIVGVNQPDHRMENAPVLESESSIGNSLEAPKKEEDKENPEEEKSGEEQETLYQADPDEVPQKPNISDTIKMPDIKRSSAEDGNAFNLEETILAAATQQGIDIPEEKEEDSKEEPENGEEESSGESEENSQEPSSASRELEEEDFLSEEDLAEAEDEFFNGPASARKVKQEQENAEAGSDAEENPEEEPLSGENEPAEEKVNEENLSEEEKLERFIDSREPKQDPTDIIPRPESLSEDEIRLFTYFVKIPGMKEQLIDTLCDVQKGASDKTSKEGNIIVMGGRETGKTRLISSLIPAICKELNLEASKVAYVFAQDINGKDISRIVDKLAGGFLVIEDANQLSQDTVNQLDKAMEFRTDGMIVILEDEKISMRKMIARYPKFARKFTSMINIPVFTNDELVNFALAYTMENGYKVDQMGMLALYNQIGESQKEDVPMNIGAVKEIIDNAIAKAEGGILKFNKKKRVDKDGFIVLHEKDFS